MARKKKEEVEAVTETKSSSRKVVNVSDAHDPSTTPSGVMSGKKPKFGKKHFGD